MATEYRPSGIHIFSEQRMHCLFTGRRKFLPARAWNSAAPPCAAGR